METNLTFLLATLHLASFVWDSSSAVEKRKNRAAFRKYMQKCQKAEEKKKKCKDAGEDYDDSSEACYMAILSLLVESPDSWVQSKMTFVRRLLSCATLRTVQQGSGARRCRRRGRSLSNIGDDAASSALFVGGGSRSSTPSCSPALHSLRTAPAPAQAFLSFLCVVDFIHRSTKTSVDSWESSLRNALARAVSLPKDSIRAPLLAFCQDEIHFPGMQKPCEVNFLFKILGVDGNPE